MSPHPPAFRSSLTTIVLFVTLLLLPASRLTAQGTSGSLPGPINSQQLMRYADRLGLSSAQRLNLEAAHDDYRLQFRALRDGEIAAFLEKQRSIQGGIPKRDAVEKLLESQESIQGKISLLDNHLFDQLVPVLTDEQILMLPRLRLARERGRYEVQQTAAAFGRRMVDLSEIFPDLDLAPDVHDAADAMLAPYERRMTTIMRKQNKAIVSMTLDMMDVLAERGYAEISQEELLENPQLLKQVVAQVQEVFVDLRSHVSKLSDELRELNDRTYRQIAAIVPADQARALRNAYFLGTHPQLATLIAQSRDDWITRALQLEALTTEQRSVLELASDEHQRRLDQLLASGGDLMDRFWEGFSPFDVNPERGETLRKDLTDVSEKAVEAKAKAEETVELQLGAETVQTLKDELGKLVSNADASALSASDGTSSSSDAGEPDAAAEFAFSGDRFLPDRISRKDISRYMKQLQIDRDMTVVLDVLHKDYLERLSNLTVFARLREARNAARPDAEGDSISPLRDRINEVFALRHEAIEAMATADAAFFDDLGALVGDDYETLLDRVRGSRLRRTFAGSASARAALGRDNSNEASVDVVSIVLAEQPSADLIAGFDALFTEYEAEANAAFRARLDAQLELQRRTDQWVAEITEAARKDIGAVLDLQSRYREEMKEPTRRVERTDGAIVELNRGALDRVIAASPAELAASVRRSYDGAAFPSIYEDPASVERHLVAARKLEDLTAQQREQLADLAGSYLDEYDRVSRSMVDNLPTSTVNAVGLEPAAFRAWQEQQQLLARSRFDRNELNGRAISRMQAILTEGQVRRIGGLPAPLGEDDFFFYR